MPNNNRKKIQLYRNEEIYTPSAQQGLSALEVAKNHLASISLSDGEVIIGRYQETNQNIKTVIAVAHDMSNNNEGMTFFTDSSDFVSRPVVLYQTDGDTGLLGVNEDELGSDWQLENYDFTPYKYLRCYFKMGNFSTTNPNLTPSMVIELPLEAASKSKSAPSGDGQACDMYVAGGVAPNPSDPTTVLSVLVAVDSTKTKFQVVYQNMYDGWQYNDNYSNSPTEANNNGRFLYKIEGCFDALNNASEIEYLEHDPIFTASPAYGITSSDITNWNDKTSNVGTVTGVKMNNTTNNPTDGVVDLGTVVTTETDPTVPNWAKSATKPSYTASEVGAVPTTRTVNGKALTGNITLTAEEVGALPDTTVIPTKVSDLTNDSGFTTNTGTITGITMNGVSKGTSGIVNLGTVVTTETDPTVPSWAKASTKPSYTASEVGAVPTTRTVNGKELSSDISLTSTDVGAVPRSRTVNEKPLSGNITLTAEDVGALPNSTVIPSKVSELTNDSGFTTNTGTITGITMNGVSKGTSGDVDLGTVITEHQTLKTINNQTITGSGNFNLVSKPIVLYETDGTTGLLGVNNNTLGNNWQLENYDFSPYKYLRCYLKMANLATNSSSLTPAMIIELPLDDASKATGSGNCDMYVAGHTAVSPSNQNQIYTVLVAVDSTKTKFQVVCENRLYGTLQTNVNSDGRYLYRIEGCFDTLNNAVISPNEAYLEQTTGNSTTSVMSQKAVTDAINYNVNIEHGTSVILPRSKRLYTQLTQSQIDALNSSEVVTMLFKVKASDGGGGGQDWRYFEASPYTQTGFAFWTSFWGSIRLRSQGQNDNTVGLEKAAGITNNSLTPHPNICALVCDRVHGWVRFYRGKDLIVEDVQEYYKKSKFIDDDGLLCFCGGDYMAKLYAFQLYDFNAMPDLITYDKNFLTVNGACDIPREMDVSYGESRAWTDVNHTLTNNYTALNITENNGVYTYTRKDGNAGDIYITGYSSQSFVTTKVDFTVDTDWSLVNYGNGWLEVYDKTTGTRLYTQTRGTIPAGSYIVYTFDKQGLFGLNTKSAGATVTVYEAKYRPSGIVANLRFDTLYNKNTFYDDVAGNFFQLFTNTQMTQLQSTFNLSNEQLNTIYSSGNLAVPHYVGEIKVVDSNIFIADATWTWKKINNT